MLKLNFKILTAHLIGIVFGIFSYILAATLNSSIVFVVSVLIIIMLYIAVGFWGNDGTHKGIMPIISIFWLSATLLLLINLPLVIIGLFNIRDGGITEILSFFPNASFIFFMFMGTAFSNYSFEFHTILLSIITLFPSSLAVLGFVLKSLYLKKR